MKFRNLAAALATGVCIVALAAPAQAQQQHEFRIPAGSLRAALDAYGRQSGRPIIYQADEVRDVRSRGYRGSATAEVALDAILAGTGFSARVDSSGAVAVVRSGEAVAGSAAARDGSAGAGATPEILVVGTRTLNTDIRRTEDDIQPYVVLGREEIEQSQAANIDEFLRSRLPQNATSELNSQAPGRVFGNASSIDLRGLGADETLILVNGRRVAGLFTSGGAFQPDLNGIPMGAIERIEILPSTASGIYGGSATGGVINIITRQDYSGINVGATYGNTFRGDRSEYRLNFNAGFNLDSDTHITIAASRSETSPLLYSDRNFFDRARALQFANTPEQVIGTAFPPPSFLPNIRSVNGSNLVLKNGAQLNSPITFVPSGYAGVSTDAGAALVANAGQYNLELPDVTLGTGGQRNSLLTDTTVNFASIGARRRFGSRVEAYADFSWSRNQNVGFVASSPSQTTLQASAPNNPFTTAINVAFAPVGLNFPNITDYRSLRAVGGVIIRLPHDWMLNADHVWNRTRYTSSASTIPVGDPDGPGPGLSVTQALQTGVLDVVRDVNIYPLDWAPYLYPDFTNIRFPNTFTLNNTTLRLSGPLFRLPGGPLTLSTGLEHRDEDGSGAYIATTNAAGATSITYYPPQSQSVTSFFSELRAPVVSSGNAIPLLYSLELQAAVRRDQYETVVAPNSIALPSLDAPLPDVTLNEIDQSATKFTVGLRYNPIRDIALRVSYGTGFLPPTAEQLFSRPVSPVAITLPPDPKRGNTQAVVTIPRTQGGSPDLVPEESRSLSAGIIFTPRFLPGLRLSVDYTRIRKINEITSLTASQLFQLEDLLPPGTISRDPLTPADAALGYTGGTVTAYALTLVNFADTRVEAFDFQADYTWKSEQLGNFRFYVIGTHQTQLARQALPGQPLIESAGWSDGVLKWRGNAGITWNRGGWTAGWNAQYYDSYIVCPTTFTEARCADVSAANGRRRVPSQAYHDLFASYRFSGTGFLNRSNEVELSIGVQNVFDRSPPIIAALDNRSLGNGYSRYGDPRLRRFTLGIQFNF